MIIWVTFMLGLLGSLHCVGMCGPLCIAVCTPHHSSLSTLKHNIIIYNLGRIATYTILGLIIGFVSNIVLMGSIQKILSILGGITLVYIGLMTSNVDTILADNAIGRKMGNLIYFLNKRIHSTFQTTPIFLSGMINGLLPCGLVYIALSGVIVSNNPWIGAISMFSFGLGTLPILIATVIFSAQIKLKFSNFYTKTLPFVTAGFGVFLLIRGFTVDIPEALNFWGSVMHPSMCK